MSEYEARAEQFCNDFGLAVKVAFKGDRCPPWCDGHCIHGDRYRVTIKRVAITPEHSGSVSFDYWNSHRDVQVRRAPRAYGLLSVVSSEIQTPDNFEDFCSDFGYETDSRKAEKTFRLCGRLARKLRGFFDDVETAGLIGIDD